MNVILGRHPVLGAMGSRRSRARSAWWPGSARTGMRVQFAAYHDGRTIDFLKDHKDGGFGRSDSPTISRLRRPIFTRAWHPSTDESARSRCSTP